MLISVVPWDKAGRQPVLVANMLVYKASHQCERCSFLLFDCSRGASALPSSRDHVVQDIIMVLSDAFQIAKPK